MFTVGDRPYRDAPGWRRTFAGGLTLGLFFPIEGYWKDEPTMAGQEALARRAEELGFAALWVRDVPLRDPGFGDLGQVYDPWVWLGWIAAHTRDVALATGAIALPLRHPLHDAKAAASVDRLSGGRLLLGVAPGDRAVEFPAFGRDPEARGEELREALAVVRRVLGERSPTIDSRWGRLEGADVVPKPTTRELPILVAGGAAQSLSWIAENAHAWVTWPRPIERQREAVRAWRAAAARAAPGEPRPFAQALYVDLVADADRPPWPIQLGFRLGRDALVAHLRELHELGVAHVALNLKPSRRPAAEVLEELGALVLPAL
jgi:luciferase-type oxidoreductase